MWENICPSKTYNTHFAKIRLTQRSRKSAARCWLDRSSFEQLLAFYTRERERGQGKLRTGSEGWRGEGKSEEEGEEGEGERETRLTSVVTVHLSQVRGSDCGRRKESLWPAAPRRERSARWGLRGRLRPRRRCGRRGNRGNSSRRGFFGGRNRCVRESRFRRG